jgi:hypothetical protein
LQFVGVLRQKKNHIILWFEWKKTFIPKDTINTLNKEIIKPFQSALVLGIPLDWRAMTGQVKAAIFYCSYLFQDIFSYV